MTKFSQLPPDVSLLLADFLAGYQTSGGNATKRVSISDLLTLLFNNVPNHTVKTPSLALSNVLDSTNGVQSFTNSGAGGGTFYYINLGGIKLMWGATSTISVGSGTTQSLNVTPPTSFFSSIQAVLLTSKPGSSAQQFLYEDGSTTSNIAIAATQSTGSTTTMTAFVLVIGT